MRMAIIENLKLIAHANHNVLFSIWHVVYNSVADIVFFLISQKCLKNANEIGNQ